MTSFISGLRSFQGSVRSMMGPGGPQSRPFSADYSDDAGDDQVDDDGGGGGGRVGLGVGASAPPPLLQMSRQDCIPPCSVKFFWGRIPRETAVNALTAKGLKQGLFILREKTDHQRNFALSVVHVGKVHHYIIERCSNGSVRVPRGKNFPGPVELIQHHQKHQDGFLCKLTTPCERPMGDSPLVFKNFTVKDLEEAVSREATRLNLSGAALLKNLGPERATFEFTVVRRLHEEMPWYHHMISRQDAEDRMMSFGHKDGLFLVRVGIQDSKKSLALSISFEGSCRHYRVSSDIRERVSIEKSSKFNSIMELIDHYYYNQDGLLHRLTDPCLAPGARLQPSKRISSSFPSNFSSTAGAGGAGSSSSSSSSPSSSSKPPPLPSIASTPLPPPPPHANHSPSSSSVSSLSFFSSNADPSAPPTPLSRRAVPPIPGSSSSSPSHNAAHPQTPPPLPATPSPSTIFSARRCLPTPPPPVEDANSPPTPPPRPSLAIHSPMEEDAKMEDAAADPHDLGLQDIWDEPPDDLPPPLLGDSSAAAAASAAYDPDTYGDVPKTLFKLNRQEIMLQNAIGTGNFGAVMKGVWLHGSSNIPVAVKTLKSPANAGSAEAAIVDNEILKEAEVMKHLDHISVIKMLGVCVDGDPYMLILEFAPLGPLHKFLRKNKTFSIPYILQLMLQVAEGMAYLESKSLVHRDLAARNILLVNETNAKISDFGLSKAIGKEQDYYRAGTAGRWPLKWYAPEAIYYWKFDSKTDVWSFGVTLWEATSYGAPPYKGMKGEEIISLIEAGQRLEQPSKCPNSVFDVLLKCWTYSPKARPTFNEVVELMKDQVMMHGSGTVNGGGANGGGAWGRG